VGYSSPRSKARTVLTDLEMVTTAKDRILSLKIREKSSASREFPSFPPELSCKPQTKNSWPALVHLNPKKLLVCSLGEGLGEGQHCERLTAYSTYVLRKQQVALVREIWVVLSHETQERSNAAGLVFPPYPVIALVLPRSLASIQSTCCLRVTISLIFFIANIMPASQTSVLQPGYKMAHLLSFFANVALSFPYFSLFSHSLFPTPFDPFCSYLAQLNREAKSPFFALNVIRQVACGDSCRSSSGRNLRGGVQRLDGGEDTENSDTCLVLV
jgi:hypothetical protein